MSTRELPAAFRSKIVRDVFLVLQESYSPLKIGEAVSEFVSIESRTEHFAEKYLFDYLSDSFKSFIRSSGRHFSIRAGSFDLRMEPNIKELRLEVLILQQDPSEGRSLEGELTLEGWGYF